MPWLGQTFVTVADGSVTGNEAQRADITDIRGPAVLATLVDDEGNANPTITISVNAGTDTDHQIHEEQVGEGDTLVAKIPAASEVVFEPDATGTWAVEVVSNPGGDVEVVEP